MLIWPSVVGWELLGMHGVKHVRVLRVSFVLSFKYLISTCQGRSEQESLVSGLATNLGAGLTSFVLLYFYFHPTGSRTMPREGKIAKKAFCSFFAQYRKERGKSCQPMGLFLLYLLWKESLF